MLVFFFIGAFLSGSNHIATIGDTPFSYREDLTCLNYVEKDLDSLNIRVMELSKDETGIVFEIVPIYTVDLSVGLMTPIYALLLSKDGCREKIIAMKCRQLSLAHRNLIRLEDQMNSANTVYIGCFLKKDLFRYKDNGVPIPFFLKKISLPQYE